jgi:cytochrome c biogenesis protein
VTQLDQLERLSTAPLEVGGRPPTSRRRRLAGPIRAWRQLTSMRTALLLLFLLALAAVPGSVIPQRGVDPTLVQHYIAVHPKLGPFIDRLYGFDVFSAPWFAAIYALLMVSLLGCLFPRLRLHARALLRRPPRAPAHPERLAYGTTFISAATPAEVLATSRAVLRRRRFRTAVEHNSLAAEKGYLRESGNLLFHISLLVLLLGIAMGALTGYKGNVIVPEGRSFTNTQAEYDTFSPGALVDTSKLTPFTLGVRSFVTTYRPNGVAADYRATVDFQPTLTSRVQRRLIRVNEPLKVGEAKVYLINNGYAPHVLLRDRSGRVLFDDLVVCVAVDRRNLTSNCILKIPDTGLPTVGALRKPEQLALRASLVPTFAANVFSGSVFPGLLNPRLVGIQVYVGDLGLDAGTPQNVYVLNTSKMRLLRVRGPSGLTSVQSLNPRNRRQDTLTGLPGGLSLTVDDIRTYAVFAVKYDPGKGLVLWASMLMVAGLIGSLMIRRRRLWIRAEPLVDGGSLIEIGGLTRTGDFTNEFEQLVRRVKTRLLEEK